MPTVGIDLGTSNSAVAVLRGRRLAIMPSAEYARRPATLSSEGSTTVFKRVMGLLEKVRLRARELSSEELSGFPLQEIRRDWEAFLGEAAGQAVATVPTYFTDNQRGARKDAARRAENGGDVRGRRRRNPRRQR